MTPKPKIKICDHPECQEPGEYRAPKDRSLKNYYWFCLKHVREYNKNWNYYAGMTEQEIEKENKFDSLSQKKTWPFGLPLKHLLKGGHVKDYFKLFSQRSDGDMPLSPQLNEKQTKAVQKMGLSYPFSKDQLKTHYKKLVKKYHPDVNKGAKEAEEKFKEISQAYRVLLDFLKH